MMDRTSMTMIRRMPGARMHLGLPGLMAWLGLLALLGLVMPARAQASRVEVVEPLLLFSPAMSIPGPVWFPTLASTIEAMNAASAEQFSRQTYTRSLTEYSNPQPYAEWPTINNKPSAYRYAVKITTYPVNGPPSLWAWYPTGTGSLITVSYACPGSPLFRAVEVRSEDRTNIDVSCVRDLPNDPAPDSCPAGNPIYGATGLKVQQEVDYAGVEPLLGLARTFRSSTGVFSSVASARFVDYAGVTSADSCVPAEYSIPIASTTGTTTAWRTHCFKHRTGGRAGGWVASPDGRKFNLSPGQGTASAASSAAAYTTAPDSRVRVAQRPLRGGASAWFVYREDNQVEVYGDQGQIVTRFTPDGAAVDFAWAQGRIATMTSGFGRSLGLGYDPSGRLGVLTDPAGGTVTYAYDGSSACDASRTCGRLVGVRYPDQSTRQYVWNEPALTAQAALVTALTGIVDENGNRYASFGYDSSMLARSTEHAGGTQRYEIQSFDDRGTRGSYTLLDPLGAARSVDFEVVGGVSYETQRSQPAGSGCDAATHSQRYDAQGNATQRDDFSGNRSCHAHDLGRNLETARVEGLSTQAACADVTGRGSALPDGARKTHTQWHPDWRLPERIAEPGRITTWVYNGRPDPFQGNATSRCTPTDAVLPDGQPLAVVCRRVEQATTDANGAAGFDAALQPDAAPRETRWTYNAQGQVLTEDGPRTDVRDVTSYAYYTDTAFTGTGAAASGHRRGDLQSVTDASGQITRFTQYDPHGNVLESIDPNGVPSRYAYDLRQRRVSASVGGATTRYTYDAAGQLTRVTLPDASFTGYAYDAAHRLSAVFDSQGNRIEYTLDNAGNRIAEQVKDPTGALRRQVTRSVDALGRVQQIVGRE